MPPPSIANPTKLSPAPSQRLPPGEGPPAGAWMGQGRRSPGPGMRDPEDAPLSPRPAGLCHQKGSPAARPPALGSEHRARSAGQRRPEFDREGGVSAKRQMSASGWGWERQNFSNASRQHAPCSPITYAAKEGRQGAASSASAPLLPFRRAYTRRPKLPRRPLSPLARLPQAPDTAITLNGNAPRRSVLSRARRGSGWSQQRAPGKLQKIKVALGSSPVPKLGGFTRTPG